MIYLKFNCHVPLLALLFPYVDYNVLSVLCRFWLLPTQQIPMLLSWKNLRRLFLRRMLLAWPAWTTTGLLVRFLRDLMSKSVMWRMLLSGVTTHPASTLMLTMPQWRLPAERSLFVNLLLTMNGKSEMPQLPRHWHLFIFPWQIPNVSPFFLTGLMGNSSQPSSSVVLLSSRRESSPVLFLLPALLVTTSATGFLEPLRLASVPLTSRFYWFYTLLSTVSIFWIVGNICFHGCVLWWFVWCACWTDILIPSNMQRWRMENRSR